MAIELEAKVRVESHEPVRAKLRQIGATFVRTATETNRFFDQLDASLHQSGRGLRLRSVVVEGGEKSSPLLTFKGPQQKSALKQREELEVAVSDAETMASILTSLGFVERISFEKRRESWRMKKCQIELDELPSLGQFVEVEGPNEAEIHAVLTQLGLEKNAVVKDHYVGMITAKFPSSGDAPIVVRFP